MAGGLKRPYARMIAAIQDRSPRRVYVELGDARRKSFRLVDFAKVLSGAILRFTEFAASGPGDTSPEPLAACPLCLWREHCKTVWEAEEHLSLVAGLVKLQA